MRTIVEVARGSGYRDIHLDDNSWERVPDGKLPGGYHPAVGDTIEITEDGCLVVGAAMEGAGADTQTGGSGADTLAGATGADTETGHE